FVTVRAGFPEANRDLVLQKSRAATTGEPDDAPFEARELAPGGAVAGAFEEPLDEDWFVLEADGLGGLEFRLRAWGIGSAADPEMAIFAADGSTLLAQNVDRRPAIFPEHLHGEVGPDRDPLVTAFLPPGPGRLFVRVRAQQGSESGYPGCFYLLHVVTGKGVPDAGRTTAVLDPTSTRTVDGPDVTLRVVPRDYFGDPVGPGASISVSRDDGGPGFVLADVGGGTYEAVIPPSSVPGEVRFSLVVDAPLGDGVVPDAATLVVAGPADAARSILGLDPRRVETGGAPATLVYEPRDAAGRLLGAGLLVSFAFDGAPAGTIGPAVDRGDGTYAAEVLSPAAPGSARVAALSGGVPTGLARIVGFGWDLPLVAADLGAETTEALGLPGLSRGEEARFARAAAKLDALADALATGSLEDAAAAAARATAALHRGASVPGGADGPAAAVELAEALRRRVRARVDAIVLPVPDPAGQRALGRARALLDRAEEVLGAGKAAAGARLLAAAARRAAPLP
ncbi:MAG TPA: Ig-like domain-containing protein, partial [Planctomycetota bacterium]|nr:Ig-like domain-containing protein [Planctomycetota bacterium]